MLSLILLRKVLATLDRAGRENRPYWFALTVPFLLSLNESLVRQEADGVAIQGPGLPPVIVDRAAFVTGDAVGAP